MINDINEYWLQGLNDVDRLLLFVRKHCQPETCAAMTFGELVNHFGDRSKAETALKQLWKMKLIAPTGAETDPEDGALFLVDRPRLDESPRDASQFVLTDNGYNAVEELYSIAATRNMGEANAKDTFTHVSDQIVVASCFINSVLMQEIEKNPDRMLSLTPREFEEFVAELFSRQGFQVQLTPLRRDKGRDILAISSGDLGQHLYLAECKRYDSHNPVGVHYIRSLYGVLEQERATKGIIATTSYFTRGARELAQDLKWRISLKDYTDLKLWIHRVNRESS